jgi:trans-aconitate methyltransferase
MNERQYKAPTRYVATRNVREYRATIGLLVNAEDVVLEVGCEWGTTTSLLARRGATVLGTDVSQECIARARHMHPGIRFEVLDAFDLRSALNLEARFTKIYMDLSGLSGYRSLLDLLALMTAYASVFRPEVIVAKSGALKHFLIRAEAWRGPTESRRRRTARSVSP